MFIIGDFAQHEVRMAAWLCKDPVMIQNLEKGFHTINLLLLERMIEPSKVVSIKKEEVDALENVLQLKYLKEVDKSGSLGKEFGDGIYTDYHYTDLFTVLEEAKKKSLLLSWKNKFKKEKTIAKESTFGPLYGMQEDSFSRLHQITMEEAKEVYRIDKLTYPLKHQWFADVKERARKDGFVQSVFGKKRRLDYKSAGNNETRIAELDRQGVNTIVQGPSSDIGVLCMKQCAKLYKQNGWDCAIAIGTVHDSLQSDCEDSIYKDVLVLKKDVMDNYPSILLGSDHVKFKGEMEYGPSLGELKAA